MVCQPSGCTLNVYADDSLLLAESDTRTGLEKPANRYLNLISLWGVRNRLLLKGSLKSPPCITFEKVAVKNKTLV